MQASATNYSEIKSPSQSEPEKTSTSKELSNNLLFIPKLSRIDECSKLWTERRNVRALLLYIDISLGHHRYREAFKMISEAINILPQNQEVNFYYARVLLIIDRNAEAVEACENLFKLNPMHFEGWVVWLYAQDSLINPSDKIDLIEKAKKRLDYNFVLCASIVNALLSFIKYEVNDQQKTLSSLVKGIAISPTVFNEFAFLSFPTSESSTAWEKAFLRFSYRIFEYPPELALDALVGGMINNRLEFVDQWYNINAGIAGDNLELIFLRILVAFQQKNESQFHLYIEKYKTIFEDRTSTVRLFRYSSKARAYFTTYLRDLKEPPVTMIEKMADFLFLIEEKELAHFALQHCCRLFPKNPLHWAQNAVALSLLNCQNKNTLRDVIGYFTIAIPLTSSDNEVQELNMHCGHVYFLYGELETALRYLIIGTKNFFSEKLLSDIYCSQKNYEAAEIHTLNALKHNDKSWFLWDFLGQIRNYKQNYLEAIEAFNKALNLCSTDPDIWLNKATALSLLFSYEESYECIVKAESPARLSEYWKFRANTAFTLGRFKEAHEAYTKLLRIEDGIQDEQTTLNHARSALNINKIRQAYDLLIAKRCTGIERKKQRINVLIIAAQILKKTDRSFDIEYKKHVTQYLELDKSPLYYLMLAKIFYKEKQATLFRKNLYLSSGLNDSTFTDILKRYESNLKVKVENKEAFFLLMLENLLPVAGNEASLSRSSRRIAKRNLMWQASLSLKEWKKKNPLSRKIIKHPADVSFIDLLQHYKPDTKLELKFLPSKNKSKELALKQLRKEEHIFRTLSQEKNLQGAAMSLFVCLRLKQIVGSLSELNFRIFSKKAKIVSPCDLTIEDIARVQIAMGVFIK